MEGDHALAVKVLKEHGVTAVEVELASVMSPLSLDTVGGSLQNNVSAVKEAGPDHGKLSVLTVEEGAVGYIVARTLFDLAYILCIGCTEEQEEETYQGK